MKIAIGSDHRGTAAVQSLVEHLREAGHEVTTLAKPGPDGMDYPEPAYAVSTHVASGESDIGVLICGTGIGMSIAANKVDGVRAALVHDELTASLARSHNNANVVCLSGDLLGARKIEKVVDTFVATEFEGGRHARRVDKIGVIERGGNPSSKA